MIHAKGRQIEVIPNVARREVDRLPQGLGGCRRLMVGLVCSGDEIQRVDLGGRAIHNRLQGFDRRGIPTGHILNKTYIVTVMPIVWLKIKQAPENRLRSAELVTMSQADSVFRHLGGRPNLPPKTKVSVRGEISTHADDWPKQNELSVPPTTCLRERVFAPPPYELAQKPSVS